MLYLFGDILEIINFNILVCIDYIELCSNIVNNSLVGKANAYQQECPSLDSSMRPNLSILSVRGTVVDQ